MSALRRNRIKNGTAFREWVDETGIDVVAKFLRIQPNTIINWLRGHCDPRVDHMRRIKRWTKGRIGYDQIIDRKTSKSLRREFVITKR